MADPNKVYVGIDVSAAHLDMAALPGGGEQRITNDPKALTERVGGIGRPWWLWNRPGEWSCLWLGN